MARLSRKFLLRLGLVLCLLSLLSAIVLRNAALPYFDGKLNAVAAPPAANVDARVLEFHRRSFVADMHADSLLWGRDLSRRQARGHVDLPRLREGGVDLQVFGVVSQVPRDFNYIANPAEPDLLPLLFFASWRHPSTWFEPKSRALAQAAEMRQLAGRGELRLVLRLADLDVPGLKAMLALEGMHALGGRAAALEELHAAGFRMMGLAHFSDNAVAGSAHGIDKYGLTDFGRALIADMERLGITLDLAHASPAAFDEALALATRPVVVSHSGVAGTCPGTRNLSDAQLRALARNGGVVGIGFWKGAVCDASVDGIVRALLHAVRVAGIDHVGLGSDFDGAIAAPFDATGLPRVTAALLAAGLAEADVARLLGGNLRRVLEANLPR